MPCVFTFKIKCTGRFRGQSLFVHWHEEKAYCPVSKHWISASLSEAIGSAYHHLGREHEMLCANPPSIWGVAASWVEIVLSICLRNRHAATCMIGQYWVLEWWALPLGALHPVDYTIAF